MSIPAGTISGPRARKCTFNYPGLHHTQRQNLKCYFAQQCVFSWAFQMSHICIDVISVVHQSLWGGSQSPNPNPNNSRVFTYRFLHSVEVGAPFPAMLTNGFKCKVMKYNQTASKQNGTQMENDKPSPRISKFFPSSTFRWHLAQAIKE